MSKLIRLIVMGAQCAFILFTSILLPSDSITLSQQEVHRQFELFGYYPEQAAKFDSGDAYYRLFQKYNDHSSLYKAAKLDNKRAMWQWFLQLSASESEQRAFWLEKSLKNNIPEAVIHKAKALYQSRQFDAQGALLHSLHLNNQVTPNYFSSTAVVNHDKVSRESRYEAFQEEYEDLLALFHLSQRPDDVSLLTSSAIRSPLLSPVFTNVVQGDCRHWVLMIADSVSRANQLADFIEQLAPYNQYGQFCFSEPIYDSRLIAICDQDKMGRAHCSEPTLEALVADYVDDAKLSKSSPNIKAIISVQQGTANARGNRIYLDKGDSIGVLIHELAHWSGLVDEYQIRPELQSYICKGKQPHKVAANLVVAPSAITKIEVEVHIGQKLWPVRTCAGSAHQAYRFREDISVMEYFDARLSPEYTQLIFNPFI